MACQPNRSRCTMHYHSRRRRPASLGEPLRRMRSVRCGCTACCRTLGRQTWYWGKSGWVCVAKWLRVWGLLDVLGKEVTQLATKPWPSSLSSSAGSRVSACLLPHSSSSLLLQLTEAFPCFLASSATQRRARKRAGPALYVSTVAQPILASALCPPLPCSGVHENVLGLRYFDMALQRTTGACNALCWDVGKLGSYSKHAPPCLCQRSVRLSHSWAMRFPAHHLPSS